MWSEVAVVVILIINSLSVAPVRLEEKLCSDPVAPVPSPEKVVPP